MSTLNFKICKSEFFQTQLGAIQEHISSYAMSLTISFVFPYGLVAAGALFFFSSPRLALRVKCRVRLAWLIKHLLCRLLYFYIPVSSQLQLRALFRVPRVSSARDLPL